MPANNASYYDVVVMGGALSGGATATLLLRQNPGLRLLIVEKSERLGRRVGEATVEVSAFFMGRVLGLTQYLNESHLVKQGLRFWFTNPESKTFLKRANSEAVTRFACLRINLIARPSTKKCCAGPASPARSSCVPRVSSMCSSRRARSKR